MIIISPQAIETLGRSVYFPGLWYFIAAWSEPFFVGIALLAGLAWLIRRNIRTWRLAASLGLGLGIAVPVNYILRRLIGRIRPFGTENFETLEYFQNLYRRSIDNSLPSNHAAATAVFTACFLLLGYRKTGIFLGILTVLVGSGRVIVGLHYPGDILAGWLVGFCGAYLGFRLEKPVTNILRKTADHFGVTDS
ncbi:MAG: phosphatase PAP2 family protein [bacterium]